MSYRLYSMPVVLTCTVLLALVAPLIGCSKPWVTANISAIAAHEVVNSAHGFIERVRPGIVERSREGILNQYRSELEAYALCLERTPLDGCVDPGPIEVWGHRWSKQVEAIDRAEDAVYAADAAVVAYSKAIVTWSELRGTDPPEVFRAACVTLGDTFTAVMQALQDFDIEYPSALGTVRSMIPVICAWGPGVIESWTSDEVTESDGESGKEAEG